MELFVKIGKASQPLTPFLQKTPAYLFVKILNKSLLMVSIMKEVRAVCKICVNKNKLGVNKKKVQFENIKHIFLNKNFLNLNF